VRVIRNDPSLTAKLIGAANSADYRRSAGEVRGLQDAISLIGLKGTRELAVSLGVVDEFVDPNLDPRLAIGDLWGHSLATAHLSECLAAHTGLCDPGQAFVAGLLHDYGRRLLTWQVPDHYLQVLASSASAGKTLQERERELIGVDHAILASRVMERWGCPAFMTKSMAMHHVSGIWENDSCDAMTSLARVLQLADALAAAMGFPADEHEDLPLIPFNWLKRLLPDPTATIAQMRGSLLERVGMLMGRTTAEIRLPKPWKGSLDQIVILGSRLMPADPLQIALTLAFPQAELRVPAKADGAKRRTLVVADCRGMQSSDAQTKISWLASQPMAKFWRLLVIGVEPSAFGSAEIGVLGKSFLSSQLTTGTLQSGVEQLLAGPSVDAVAAAA